MNRGCSTCKKFREDKWCIECNYESRKTTAKKVIGGGEHDGATCWIECSSCHGAVDAKDTYCKHCGAKFLLPFTEEDDYFEAMGIVQECKRGKS